MEKEIIIIGAGLAGSEAAWQAANRGLKVTLYEMRPGKKSPAHQTEFCAELVCSNSFRSDDAVYNAVGLLHQEMRQCGSLIMRCADEAKVPAGGALAVDRDIFSQKVTERLAAHPNITVIREEFTDLRQKARNAPNTLFIVATGPLTSDALSAEIIDLTGTERLAFFDAIAPIVYAETIDFAKAWRQSRYDKVGPMGDGKDYINCAMDKTEYLAFLTALRNAEKTEFKEWEKNTPYFEACLPIEVPAARGDDTLRFGPLKPVGLTNPHKPEKPYAVVQLRQDNMAGTLYNMVGFQTKLKYGAQADVFRLIPGLEKAEFARLGGIHRNTFIHSPVLLDCHLRLKTQANIFFAGQITGCEGYAESSAVGLCVGRFAAAFAQDKAPQAPPRETALGALLNHITEGGKTREDFQPMNVNFGLFPPADIAPTGKRKKIDKKERAAALSARAQEAIKGFAAV